VIARSVSLLLLIAVVLSCSSATDDRPRASATSGNVEVELLSEGASVQPGRPFHVGLRMRMHDGWHTYWKNPGDAGLPLRIAWDLPEGFTAGPIEWPAPERISGENLVSYGYHGEVLLPVEITPPATISGKRITLGGTFEWLECAEICVPASATLSRSLPVQQGLPAPGSHTASFAEARARIPAAPDGWTFAATAGAGAILLEFHVPPGAASLHGAYLFVDRPLVVDYVAAQRFERKGAGYRLTVNSAPNAQEAPDRMTGVLVVEADSGPGARSAVRVDVAVRPGGSASVP